MKQNINCFLRPEKDANPAVGGVLFEMDIILLKKSRGDRLRLTALSHSPTS